MTKKFIKDLVQAIISVKAYHEQAKPTGNVKVYGAIGVMPTDVQQAVGVAYQKARLSYESSQIVFTTNIAWGWFR